MESKPIRELFSELGSSNFVYFNHYLGKDLPQNSQLMSFGGAYYSKTIGAIWKRIPTGMLPLYLNFQNYDLTTTRQAE